MLHAERLPHVGLPGAGDSALQLVSPVFTVVAHIELG